MKITIEMKYGKIDRSSGNWGIEKKVFGVCVGQSQLRVLVIGDCSEAYGANRFSKGNKYASAHSVGEPTEEELVGLKISTAMVTAPKYDYSDATIECLDAWLMGRNEYRTEKGRTAKVAVANKAAN